MACRLLSQNPTFADIDVGLDGVPATLGRIQSNDIQVEHPSYSSKHCKVFYRASDMNFCMEDTSSNGTFVNAIKVGKGRTVVLQNDDNFTLCANTEEKARKDFGAQFVSYRVEIPQAMDEATLQYGPMDEATQEYSHDEPPDNAMDTDGEMTKQPTVECNPGSSTAVPMPPPAQPATSLEASYTITDQVLGTGNFAVVKCVIHKRSKEQLACKVINKKKFRMNGKWQERLESEVAILKTLQHRGIVQVKEVMETTNELNIVTELMRGGELFDYIIEADAQQGLTEDKVRHIFHQLLQALEYLHDHNIIHRDLKPENILLLDKPSPGQPVVVKLADFGVAKIISQHEHTQTMCGTPYYLAPEIIEKIGHSYPADMWSLGVILFIMLSGSPPFSETRGDSKLPLNEQICRGNFSFGLPIWKKRSSHAKGLIKALLTVDQSKRCTVKQALMHSWIRGSAVPSQKTCLASASTQLQMDTQTTTTGEGAAEEDGWDSTEAGGPRDLAAADTSDMATDQPHRRKRARSGGEASAGSAAGSCDSTDSCFGQKPTVKCSFGEKCYRKNPLHFQEFDHPWWNEDEIAAKIEAFVPDKKSGHIFGSQE